MYLGDPWFRERFLALARTLADRRLIARHYLHLGEGQRRTYFGDGKEVPQKKVFYALRPAAALRWLRLHPREAVAPMHFPTLLQQSELPAGLAAITTDLMARKARTRELGTAPLPKLVADFVDDEFERARPLTESRDHLPTPEARAAAERFFREAVDHFERLERQRPMKVEA